MLVRSSEACRLTENVLSINHSSKTGTCSVRCPETTGHSIEKASTTHQTDVVEDQATWAPPPAFQDLNDDSEDCVAGTALVDPNTYSADMMWADFSAPDDSGRGCPSPDFSLEPVFPGM